MNQGSSEGGKKTVPHLEHPPRVPCSTLCHRTGGHRFTRLKYLGFFVISITLLGGKARHLAAQELTTKAPSQATDEDLPSAPAIYPLARIVPVVFVLSGCAVVAVVDTAASVGVKAAGVAADAAIGTVKIVGKGAGKAADAVTGGDSK